MEKSDSPFYKLVSKVVVGALFIWFGVTRQEYEDEIAIRFIGWISFAIGTYLIYTSLAKTLPERHTKVAMQLPWDVAAWVFILFLCSMALVFYAVSWWWVFNDEDISFDLGILILKSGFVKFCWAIVNLIILYYFITEVVIYNYKRWRKKKGNA